MNIALDLGSMSFRTLRRTGAQLTARRLTAQYISVPSHSPAAKLARKTGVSTNSAEGFELIVGDDAIEMSQFVQAPLTPFLDGGKIPANDPIARQLIGSALDALLPTITGEAGLCVLALPGGHLDLASNPEMDYLSRAIGLKNYTIMPLHASLALGLAELGDSSFTGVALTLGASCCELSVIRYGVELAYAYLPMGGLWIEEQLAQKQSRFTFTPTGERFLDVLSVRNWMSSEQPNLHRPKSDEDKQLAEAFNQLLTQVEDEMGTQLGHQSEALFGIGHPLPLIIGGGLTMLDGAAPMLMKRFRESFGPVVLSSARVVKHTPFTICRGCLIHAELERTYAQSLNAA
jgi:hypothetical protein